MRAIERAMGKMIERVVDFEEQQEPAVDNGVEEPTDPEDLAEEV